MGLLKLLSGLLLSSCYISLGYNTAVRPLRGEEKSMTLAASEPSLDTKTIDSTYFGPYGTLYEQQRMLNDDVRMEAYYKAIMESGAFKGKVVLDIGAGTGVLSVWAAKAGAKHVYAIEATEIADKARAVVAANGVGDVVTVINERVENVKLEGLPDGGEQQVDIIVSEWMGLALLRESMVDVVLDARDRFLKPTGSMWPSHVSVTMALVSAEDFREEQGESLATDLASWERLQTRLADMFDFDIDALREDYISETSEHYMGQAHWQTLTSDQLVASTTVWHGDLLKDPKAHFAEIRNAPIELKVPYLTREKLGRTKRVHEQSVDGVAVWFDAKFSGFNEDNGETEKPSVITLSTAPSQGYQHWGQQLCLFSEPLYVSGGDTASGHLSITRRQNWRMYDISYAIEVLPEQVGVSEVMNDGNETPSRAERREGSHELL